MVSIVFATNNKNKVKEVQRILNQNGAVINLITYEEAGVNIEVEENMDTLEGNALKKAKESYEILNKPVIAEDFGFFITQYPEIAGVHSNRWFGGTPEDRNNELLKRLQNASGEQRKAYYKSVFVYYDGINEIVVDGYTNGAVAFSKRGNNGFAYDTVLELENGKTIAELSDEEKDKVSSRGEAIKKLAERIICL